MIYAVYNGVPMRSLKIEGFLKEMEYTFDEAQPIGVHVDLMGTFAVNPGFLGADDFARAAAGTMEPDLEGPGAFGPGVQNLSPIELLVLATQRLSVPCRPLVAWGYVNGGGKGNRVTHVQSPLKDANGRYYACDARNGPTPKVLWSEFDSGTGSVILGFNVSTDLPLCDYPNAPAITSNRWSYEVSADDDNYAQHVITGRATFRKDLMGARGLTPDMLRSWFMPQVPLGFKRRVGPVVYDPAGDAVDYTAIDTEQATDKPGIQAYGASRVEVMHAREHASPGAANKVSVMLRV